MIRHKRHKIADTFTLTNLHYGSIVRKREVHFIMRLAFIDKHSTRLLRSQIYSAWVKGFHLPIRLSQRYNVMASWPPASWRNLYPWKRKWKLRCILAKVLRRWQTDRRKITKQYFLSARCANSFLTQVSRFKESMGETCVV